MRSRLARTASRADSSRAGRLCPHPALPIDQGVHSAYIGPDGKVVIPEGTELPTIVPFERAE